MTNPNDPQRPLEKLSDIFSRNTASAREAFINGVKTIGTIGTVAKNSYLTVKPVFDGIASGYQFLTNNMLARGIKRTIFFAVDKGCFVTNANGEREYSARKAQITVIGGTMGLLMLNPALDAAMYYTTASHNQGIFTNGRTNYDGLLRFSGCTEMPCEDRGDHPRSRLRIFEIERSLMPWSYNPNPLRIYETIPQGLGYCEIKTIYGVEFFVGRTRIFLPNVGRDLVCRAVTQDEQNQAAERMRQRMLDRRSEYAPSETTEPRINYAGQHSLRYKIG